MGWKLIEKPKTVMASKSLVTEFVEMEPAPHDRPLSERRLLVYERILRSKLFRPVTWASAVCYETNCTYRVKGKHTSLLLSRIDPIPEFYVTLDRYGCDHLTDVATLYGTFDNNLASRTINDINTSFAGSIPELREVPGRLINLTVSAASMIKWSESELKRVPPAERAEELLDRVGFAKWLREVITTVDTRSKMALCKHMLRASVVQAMMMTYDKAPLIAKQFWIMVRDESSPDRDDPSRTLARFLIRAALTSARTHNTDRKIVSHREMLVKCIRAWNAWRAGEHPSNLLYYPNAEIPKVSK